MDEFVELRDERDLAVRVDQGIRTNGRSDLRPSEEADAEPARGVQATMRAARLEERGILEALRGT